MKLFVDDIRNAPDDSWTVARTVSAAIRTIARFGTELTDISLDHDISHQVGMGAVSRPYPCEETFEAVAYYIAAYYIAADLPSPTITLHTSNHIGAKSMQAVLLGWGGLKSEITPSSSPANRLEMEA